MKWLWQDDLTALLRNQEAPKPLLHPNLAEVYRRQVADLQTALADAAMRDEAAEIIRSLVEAIVLPPEDGQLRVDLSGELAAILRLGADGNLPADVRAEELEQIKLVAGARIRLCRTMLKARRTLWVSRDLDRVDFVVASSP